MTYQYKRPDGELHKVSLRKWHKVFARGGRWPFVVAYVYVTEDRAIIHFKTSVIGKIALVLLLPMIYPVGVFLGGHKEVAEEIKRTLFQNKYGSFGVDHAYRDTESWDKLMWLIEDWDL